MQELAVVNQNLAPVMEFSKDQIELIKTVVAKEATDDELKLFLYTAKRTGLDPLARQIHFVKRKGQMAIQTAIDGYRVIADRTGTLAGIDDAVYDTEDADHPNKASVTVKKLVGGVICSFTATARWTEYYPGDAQGFMWKKMPYLMLAKCAEALALRKAFPADLSGIYTNEEMQQADRNEPGQVIDLTPKSNRKSASQEYFCQGCGVSIKQAVHAFSSNKFGKPLCMDCQKTPPKSEFEKSLEDPYEGTPFPTAE